MQGMPAIETALDPITFRCPHCNRLLFKGRIYYVEIKCPKCGCIHIAKEQAISTVLQRDTPGKRGTKNNV